MSTRRTQTSRQDDNRRHRISIQEAGERGERAFFNRYDPEHYQEIGRKGGRSVSSKYGSEFYRAAIGSKRGHVRWNEDYEEDEGDQKYVRRGRQLYADEDEEENERSSRNQYRRGQQAGARRGSESYADEEFDEGYVDDEEENEERRL